jgi:hypothetical protein
VAGLSAEAAVLESVVVLESALVEAAAAELERIPVADVVVRADLLQELLALQREQLVAATMKKHQV